MPYFSYGVFKGPVLYHQDWGGLAVTSRLKNICPFLCFSDITSWHVYLDVWWIDQSTSRTLTNVAHLSGTVIHLAGHAHLWCQMRQIFKSASDSSSHPHLFILYNNNNNNNNNNTFNTFNIINTSNLIWAIGKQNNCTAALRVIWLFRKNLLLSWDPWAA